MAFPKLFFRNDDLGWDLRKFERLLHLFAKHKHKLNAAAIPLASFEEYQRADFAGFEPYLQVHAHGLAHLDHEENGKKCEFGSARDREAVRRDLQQSFSVTEKTFQDLFFPAFTPPWNRIQNEFIALLPEVGFKMLSRDGDKNAALPGLRELNIDIDLHTSKIKKTWTGDSLLQEILAVGTRQHSVGVMLHHKHMSDEDYAFLGDFLEQLNRDGIPSYYMSELS